jgi:uncharacterized protein (DUF885 family)
MNFLIRSASIALFCIFISQCKPASQTVELSAPNFDSLISAYHEENLRLYPLRATSAGDNRYNDVFANYLTDSFREQLGNHFQHYLNQLELTDTLELSVNQRLSYEVLKWNCTVGLDGLNYPSHLLPIDQFWTKNLTIGRLAAGKSSQPFKTVQDYDNWISRVDDFIDWSDTAISNMRRGITMGVVLPTVLVEKVIPQMKVLTKGPTETHLFYKPVLNLPASFSVEEISAIQEAYRTMIEGRIVPMYQRMTNFLNAEYLPAARETHGYSSLPKGNEWYNTRIKYYTTTSMAPEEIFAIGEREVKKIETEMRKVMSSVGFGGELKAFFVHVRTREELMPYSDPEQVLENFRDIHERMLPNLEKLFGQVPSSTFEVRRTERFREASASAEYQAGSVDGSRPGIFYVPIPNVTSYNTFSDEDLFLHEAIPGHHYQESLQRESEEIPMFRKLMWYSSYGEGWALYAESLGAELGLYTDPYQFFGMLSAEMHRAIRLVVDVGIHTKGWSRERAIQYSLDHEAESEATIIPEIERYMAGPGQALSYKIGQLKIRELRAKAEQELGDSFNIRAFHNTILETGCVPLTVLEGHVNRWIEKNKASN